MIELSTDRLRLRPWLDDDLEPLHTLQGDAEMMRFMGAAGPLTLDESREWLEGHREAWERDGFGIWAAELKDDGRFVGRVGLARPQWIPTDAMPEPPGEIEVAWFIAHDLQGQGQATEGGRASLDHGFSALGVDRIIGIHQALNASSQRVMEKLGMTHLDDLPHPRLEGVTVRIWEARPG